MKTIARSQTEAAKAASNFHHIMAGELWCAREALSEGRPVALQATTPPADRRRRADIMFS